MGNNKRVVVTGIGPIASTGIGKEAFWKGITEQRVGLNSRDFTIDGGVWDSFPVHGVENFDFANFNVDENAISYIK